MASNAYAYKPTIRDDLAALLLRGAERGGTRDNLVRGIMGSGGAGPAGAGLPLIDFTPLGIPLAAQEAGRMLGAGAKDKSALGVAGGLTAAALTVLPGGKAAAKAAKAAAKAAEKKAASFAVDKAAKVAKAPSPLAVFPKAGLEGADSPLLISTRRPTAPNFAVYGNPDEQLLIQSGDALRANPKAFEKNMAQLAEEPFMQRVNSADPEKIYNYGVREGANNLKFIANELMTPAKSAASQEWYPVAQRVSGRAAKAVGLPPEAGYGVTAVTSPQTPWDINAAKMERLLQMHANNFQMSPDDAVKWAQTKLANAKTLKDAGAVAPMPEDWIRRVSETPVYDLSTTLEKYAKVVLSDATQNDPMVRKLLLSGEYGDPSGQSITWGASDSVNKALNIMRDPSMASISRQMEGGGKVPSFYNNIAAPYSKAPISTIDTHSAGAFSLSPGGGNDPIVYRAMGLGPSGKGMPPGPANPATTGAKGLYGPVSDAHTLAGKELGLRPNATQSVTWEGVRDLWGQSGKTPELKRDIANILRNAPSPDAARFAVAARLGKPVRRMFAVKKKK